MPPQLAQMLAAPAYALQEIRLVVVSTNPKGAVFIDENTEVELLPEAVDQAEIARGTITYDDLGGMGETIDQLVDPQRSIPEAGIPIHHIHPHMVRGMPTIGQVLPVFHRFAAGSVLVGHNVAFDMRFLKLKEAATGCVFDHPVLDTLLLSSVVHPAEESHSLEAIAARLGITIGGRHTALGDARATAEVFTRLIPLLARQGVTTLGEAREASGRSQFARLRY
mgnify:CR=1 FL=1